MYEAGTDVRQGSEYGTEPGNLYVKVEVGPDGVGSDVATVSVSVADDDVFTGSQSTAPSASDTKVRGVFSQGENKASVRFAGYVVMGSEFDYSRYDDTGWVRVTVSFRCPG